MYSLLIIIGITLIVLNIKAIRREEKSFSKVMGEVELDVDELDMRLVEIRSEFAKTVTEIQREISDLKKESYVESKENFKNHEKIINNMSEEQYNISKKKLTAQIDKSNEESNLEVKESNENIRDLDKENSNNEYISTLVDKINSLDDDIIIQVDNKDKLIGESKEEEKDTDPKKVIKNNSLKVEDVKKLLSEGLNEDAIAQRLNIGKGEVLLIKELYSK